MSSGRPVPAATSILWPILWGCHRPGRPKVQQRSASKKSPDGSEAGVFYADPQPNEEEPHDSRFSRTSVVVRAPAEALEEVEAFDAGKRNGRAQALRDDPGMRVARPKPFRTGSGFFTSVELSIVACGGGNGGKPDARRRSLFDDGLPEERARALFFGCLTGGWPPRIGPGSGISAALSACAAAVPDHQCGGALGLLLAIEPAGLFLAADPGPAGGDRLCRGPRTGPYERKKPCARLLGRCGVGIAGLSGAAGVAQAPRGNLDTVRSGRTR